MGDSAILGEHESDTKTPVKASLYLHACRANNALSGKAIILKLNSVAIFASGQTTSTLSALVIVRLRWQRC